LGLKGRSVAVVSRGAILVYDDQGPGGGGLTLADINLKYIPFGPGDGAHDRRG
jgi:hypothetical protein